MNCRVDDVIRQLAAQQGVSEAELLASMQEALDEGMRDPDPAVQAEWKHIPHRGEKPTPQEVIAYLAQKLGRS